MRKPCFDHMMVGQDLMTYFTAPDRGSAQEGALSSGVSNIWIG
jgi:hypothetical protein